MRARPRPRHGWLAPTASPHALARWGGSRHAAAQGTTLRRPRRARYGARKLTALSQVASPRAIGALSLHDATRVAELRARGACLGRASSGRRAGVERGRARAGALERSRLGPRTTCSWVRGRASGGASGHKEEVRPVLGPQAGVELASSGRARAGALEACAYACACAYAYAYACANHGVAAPRYSVGKQQRAERARAQVRLHPLAL